MTQQAQRTDTVGHDCTGNLARTTFLHFYSSLCSHSFYIRTTFSLHREPSTVTHSGLSWQPTNLGGEGEVGILKVCWLCVSTKVVLCIKKGEGRLAIGVSEARVHLSS